MGNRKQTFNKNNGLIKSFIGIWKLKDLLKPKPVVKPINPEIPNNKEESIFDQSILSVMCIPFFVMENVAPYLYMVL